MQIISHRLLSLKRTEECIVLNSNKISKRIKVYCLSFSGSKFIRNNIWSPPMNWSECLTKKPVVKNSCNTVPYCTIYRTIMYVRRIFLWVGASNIPMVDVCVCHFWVIELYAGLPLLLTPLSIHLTAFIDPIKGRVS